MFDNIGGKIKCIAQIFTWLGIGFACIGGFVLIATGSVVIGFLTILLGCISSWLSGLFLYGFGQVIDNTDYLVSININIHGTNPRLAEDLQYAVNQTKNNFQAGNFSIPFRGRPQTTPSNAAESTVVCPQCKLEQPLGRKVCWQCGFSLENVAPTNPSPNNL